MALKQVAQGTSVEEFKDAVSNTSGDGITVIEVDVQDKVVIPFFPDLPIGGSIRAALPGLDLSLKAIPGVHLVRPSTYRVQGDTGTLRVEVRTNPLPLLPVAVPGLIVAVFAGLSIFGISVVLGWRILRAEPGELVAGGFFTIIALGLVGIAAFILLRRYGG